jgi:hypothetical protein
MLLQKEMLSPSLDLGTSRSTGGRSTIELRQRIKQIIVTRVWHLTGTNSMHRLLIAIAIAIDRETQLP